jgi:hypothetical protein
VPCCWCYIGHMISLVLPDAEMFYFVAAWLVNGSVSYEGASTTSVFP